MSMLRTLRRLMCTVGLLASVSAPGWADIRYVTETTIDRDGEQQTMTTMTTEVKGKRERVAMKMSMGPMQMQRVTLTLCDQGQRIEYSDVAKVYTVSPLNPFSHAAGGAQDAPRKRSRGSGKGEIVSTVTVKDLGPEKIGTFDTHHYVINTALQESGCVGTDQSKFDSEMWVAPSVPIFSCPAMQQEKLTVNEDDCSITYVTKGDVQKFATIQSGLIVQRKFAQPGAGPMVQRVTSYDGNATVPDAHFQVPPGYTKVSQEAFEQAVMRAMMEKMQAPPTDETE